MKHHFRRDSHTAVVTTRLGKIRGYEWDGLTIFKGIPYAKARRFHAPEPLAPWDGVRDASCYGCVCPLLESEKPDVETLVPHRYWPMDENCQNLNIWTPALDGAKRPVAVWLHGGGFFAGSAIEQAAYDGAAMSRLGDAVVVTVNHRLNILGYFDLSDFGAEYANSGNAGGDDIVMALKWIHENIALFGGDPDNVTVFGQSGGGAKVTTLLQTPAADGLYAKGMVMSGVLGVLGDAVGSGRELAEAVMAKLGVEDVRALETVSFPRLSEAYLAVRPEFAQAGKYIGCCPHPNAYYLGDPLVNGFRAETAHVPLLVGSVFGEFSSFTGIPYDRDVLTEAEAGEMIADELGEDAAETLIPLFRAAYPERRISDLLRLDTVFRAPEIAYIRRRAALNGCTWSYLFNMDQPIEGGNTPWHCADIPYVFHNIDLVEYPHGPQADETLSERMEEAIFQTFMAFARTGSPANPLIPEWRASTPEREAVLVLDAHTRVRENFDHALIPELEKARAARPMKIGSVAH